LFLIELNNNKLVSSSDDNSLIFYYKDNNNKYIKEYQFNIDGYSGCLIQTKENEICFSEYVYAKDKYSIYFYNLLEK